MKEDIRAKLEKEIEYYRERNKELEFEASRLESQVQEASTAFEKAVEEMGELDDFIELLEGKLGE